MKITDEKILVWFAEREEKKAKEMGIWDDFLKLLEQKPEVLEKNMQEMLHPGFVYTFMEDKNLDLGYEPITTNSPKVDAKIFISFLRKKFLGIEELVLS